MMILDKADLLEKRKEIKNRIRRGSVFIHPTDTIYGIGCNAKNTRAVRKIRSIKKRKAKPFSVIAPSKSWIKKNCVIGNKWLSTLPAAYTFILNLKYKNAVSKQVNLGRGTIGVRMPDHWFAGFLRTLRLPIVTTSVNVSKNSYMTSIDDLDKSIANKVDFIVYEGPRRSYPSRIIDLTKDKPRIVR